MANEGEDTHEAGASELLLILGAVAVGAAIALLYAPRSGKRTRRQLRRGYEEIRDRAAELSDDLVDRVDDLRQFVAGRMEAGQEYVGQKKDDLLSRVSALQDSLEGLKRRLGRQ